MEQKIYSAFEATQLIRIPFDVASAWKAAGSYLWENNGWNDLGNSCLYPSSYPDMLIRETQRLGVNWKDYAEYVSGYTTLCFGFYLGNIANCSLGVDEDVLNLCIQLIQESNIEWCGSLDPPFFQLVATEQQIIELIQCLEKPIAEWRYKEQKLQNG